MLVVWCFCVFESVVGVDGACVLSLRFGLFLLVLRFGIGCNSVAYLFDFMVFFILFVLFVFDVWSLFSCGLLLLLFVLV